MPTKQKIATVDHLTQQMQEAKAVVFTDYRGLTVNQIQELRKELAKHNASLEVTKNSLMGIAAKQAEREVDTEILLVLSYSDGPPAS